MHDAAGIHDKIGAIADAAVAVLAIARQTGCIGHQRRAAARQPVEKCGFSDIGAADKNDNGFHGLGNRDP